MLKKTTSLLILAALLVSTVTGCGGGGAASSAAENAQAGTESSVSEGAAADDKSENVNIHIFGSFWPAEQNELTLYLLEQMEEVNNVTIELEVPPQSSYTESLQMMLAGGDYPDVVNFSDHTDKMFTQGVDTGLFVPITEEIQNAPNLLAHTYDVTWEAVKTKQDDDIYMMYKAVSDEGEMPKGGAVVCGMAVADHPLGPFQKSDQPILTNPENPWSVEDPFLWYEDGRFWAVAKDFQGYFTKAGAHSVALFESPDGFSWEVSKEHPLAFRLELHWEDGTVEPLQNMERPQMWLDEDGKPRVICCACTRFSDPKRLYAFNVQIAIK